MLIPREEYLSSGCHIGLIYKTKDMKRFIYKIRPNGLSVLNLSMLDERIHNAASMLSKAKKVLVVSRKEGGHKAIIAFARAIGAIAMKGRFMPGSLTNPTYKAFFEPDILFTVDTASDRQAIGEATQMRIPIIALADTFSSTSYIDLIIPCNNKSKNSIGLILFLLAREINNLQGKQFSAKLEDFTPPKEEGRETVMDENVESTEKPEELIEQEKRKEAKMKKRDKTKE
ncbi:MAG: 30S ribosomal protein S2 [Candidatus Aenigmatarchaeota archaeon]